MGADEERTATTKRLFPVLAIAAGLATGAAAVAQEAEPVFPKLTPRLQDLLQREMVSLNQASQEILTAPISGDDRRVDSR